MEAEGQHIDSFVPVVLGWCSTVADVGGWLTWIPVGNGHICLQAGQLITSFSSSRWSAVHRLENSQCRTRQCWQNMWEHGNKHGSTILSMHIAQSNSWLSQSSDCSSCAYAISTSANCSYNWCPSLDFAVTKICQSTTHFWISHKILKLIPQETWPHIAPTF